MNNESKEFLARQEFRVRYGVRRLQYFFRTRGVPSLALEFEYVYRQFEKTFELAREVMKDVGNSKND